MNDSISNLFERIEFKIQLQELMSLKNEIYNMCAEQTILNIIEDRIKRYEKWLEID
jgi:hypothetical protein